MAVSRLCEDTVDAEEHMQVLHFHADFYISHIETFSSRTKQEAIHKCASTKLKINRILMTFISILI